MIIYVRMGSKVSKTEMKYLAHVGQYLTHLFMVNIVSDPIIYTIRIREVRLGYRKMIARMCCRKLHGPNSLEESQLMRNNITLLERKYLCSHMNTSIRRPGPNRMATASLPVHETHECAEL